MIIRPLALIATLLGFPTIARSQTAATVSSESAVYDAIDELEAVVPVPGVVIGQRVYSRREVARIALVFDAEIERRRGPTARPWDPADRTRALVDALLEAYDPEVRAIRGEADDRPVVSLVPLAGVRLEADATDSRRRLVPSNGLGGIDALTNPIAEPRVGRPIAYGVTTSLETLHTLGIGDHVAFAAQPRLTFIDERHGRRSLEADFQRLYGRAVVYNAAVEVGLDDYQWGQGGSRGMFLSANTRPLHALTIGTDTAVFLPWFLRYLGRTRASFLIANLGLRQNFPGAKLVAYKISITPAGWVELGAGLMDQMGGNGAPPSSFLEKAKDLFPYIFWVLQPGSDVQASNKIATLDARIRIPRARGMTVYYEINLDDFDTRRLWSTYWQDSGHLLGASWRRLTDDGRLTLDLELHHTSLRLYEHPQFTSGVTYREGIIGDPLGPNAQAAYATLGWRSGLMDRLSFAGAYESRDPSLWGIVPGDVNNNGFGFVRTSEGTPERRVRGTATYEVASLSGGVTVLQTLAVERVSNAGFTLGTTQTNVLAQLVVRVGF